MLKMSQVLCVCVKKNATKQKCAEGSESRDPRPGALAVGLTLPPAQMGVASRRAGSSLPVPLSSQVTGRALGCVLPHGTRTPTTACAQRPVGSPVKTRFLVPSLGGTPGGRCCDATQLLHKVLQSGHPPPMLPPPWTRVYLFPGFLFAFRCRPQHGSNRDSPLSPCLCLYFCGRHSRVAAF